MKVLEFVKKYSILFHLLGMIVVAFLLLLLLFNWLDIYSRHGEAQPVPDVRGLTIEEATQTLQDNGMECSVVDSLFVPDAKPNTVLEQTPGAKTLVKGGRRIYVTVNAKSAQMVTFPDVVDMSLRQAIVQIEAAGFVVKRIKHEPSNYKDLVLYVDYKGEEVKTAQKLPYRSEVVLHVGKGKKSND